MSASARGQSHREAPTVNLRVLVAGMALVLPLIALLLISFGRDPRAVPFVMGDKPAPTFELVDLDGNTWSLEELEGQPVVINFWATWCAACKVEYPLLMEAQRTAEDVRFLGVLYGDQPERARRYLQQRGQAYPHLVDPDGRTAVDYGVGGVPETYFITADGILAYKQSGPVDRALLAEVLEPLREQP